MDRRDRMSIELKLAALVDIPTLIALEKKVSELKTYSAMLEESEWVEEIRKGKVFLIMLDGQVIGNISYQEKEPRHIYISGFLVDPSFQGRGIGREALRLVLEKMSDAKRIDLVTHPDNHAALRLYDAFGFSIESRKENYFGDGEPRLVLALQRA